ncbi:MAG: alpha/beta fold hydrolase, partial [Myxococcales bacterium]|nr:alpha/beta fold hydrolase [Myxococcales bacterium]
MSTAAGEPSLHRVRTRDGWKLALHAYRARGTRNAPVILCHGLSSNRIVFDVSPETSLARHLAELGYAVFALELRGHGASESAQRTGPRRFDWCLDDYLAKDVPAALAAVQSMTGVEGVHWIGHSMGGMLLYTQLATGGSAAIRSGITVGSSVDYGQTG